MIQGANVAPNKPLVSVIFAAAENGVIGRDNALPWHLPEDLRYFKAVTLGKPVVMGRKTYQSIGRPLPGRANIVISRDPQFHAEGLIVVDCLEAALARARDLAGGDGVSEVMVIGGAQIYAAVLPEADRLYVTEVHAAVDGDAYIPAIDWQQWQEIERVRHPASGDNPYDYSFVQYRRYNAGSI